MRASAQRALFALSGRYAPVVRAPCPALVAHSLRSKSLVSRLSLVGLSRKSTECCVMGKGAKAPCCLRQQPITRDSVNLLSLFPSPEKVALLVGGALAPRARARAPPARRAPRFATLSSFVSFARRAVLPVAKP